MTAQFDRKCALVIGDASGNALDLSDLHIKFTITRSDVQSPAAADIRIYNLSNATSRRIEEEFTDIQLQAGYEGNIGLIFSGKVRQFRRGRENATDTYLDILAQDGDEAYNFAVVNTTLAAGWMQEDLRAALMTTFNPYGIVDGYVPEFGGTALPRAKVCYGMSRDYMRNLAESAGASWYISDGAVNIVPATVALPGDIETVTRATGMIGLPQQTINGVTVRCLINPRIRHGSQIKIDNASVQQQSFNIAYQPGASNQAFAQNAVGAGVVNNTGLDADGNYKVYSITITGDTRGQEWYFDMICVGLNATAPLAGPYINATASSTGF